MNSEQLAWRMRCHAIDMVHNSHASHIGAVLSVVDILAVLYANILKYDSKNPGMDERDRVILSKGHAGVAMYAVLAECGYFPIEDLNSYYKDGSSYSGHISHVGVPGVEFSTGSLGHGISVGCGIAISAKIQNKKFRVYAIVGDGECEEGVVWETALIASHRKLDNFTVIVDHNHMQAMGNCKDISAIEPMQDKWKAFGFEVINVADGNSHDQLYSAFTAENHGRPKCIIANTVKGKGISFMENQLKWHYSDPQGEFYELAKHELEEAHI